MIQKEGVREWEVGMASSADGRAKLVAGVLGDAIGRVLPKTHCSGDQRRRVALIMFFPFTKIWPSPSAAE